MNPDSFNRRDFLKLAGLLSLGASVPKLERFIQMQEKPKNIIVIVFDAFSAYNISAYGYPRLTTPNIDRLRHFFLFLRTTIGLRTLIMSGHIHFCDSFVRTLMN